MLKKFLKLLQNLLLSMALALPVHALSLPLPPSVLLALKQAHIPLSSIGLEIREVDGAKALISINAERAMNPASTMKLLTTYAGMEMLGPSYVWKTEAYLDGELRDGVLYGNLVFRGYGDPKFTVEQFWLWLLEMRGRGLREIRGDLVLDRSYFDLPEYDPMAFDNDPVRAYNVGPDALLLNFNTLRLRFLPEGQHVRVITEPVLNGLHLDNQLSLLAGSESTKGGCDNWDDQLTVQPNGDSVTLRGGYPEGCGEHEKNVSILSHTRYMAELFHTLWQEIGGEWHGAVREGRVVATAKLFSTHHSAHLSELIRDINKFSNNVMARQLFLTLGAEPSLLGHVAGSGVEHAHGSIENSKQAIQAWIKLRQLDFSELVLENGAGLSRMERISSTHLADLLQLAAQGSYAAEMEASLPILGVDGTVKKRFKGSELAGCAHLKTGTLDGVKSMAGYVRDGNGKRWIVVFIINHANAAQGYAVQDALIEWLVKH